MEEEGKNILDEGVMKEQSVIITPPKEIKSFEGTIRGADFYNNIVTILISIPASWVKSKQSDLLTKKVGM